MTFTGRRARWLGAGTETQKPGREAGRRQRQRQYQAVELPCGAQVSVNDVVETDKKRRLAQVLSMWEDVTSGSRKFRARWLVRPADLPTKTSPRRRLGSSCRHLSADVTIGSSTPASAAAGSTDPWSSTGESLGTSMKGGKRGENKFDTEDYFLTSRTEDLDLSSMARLVVLSLPGTVNAKPGTRNEAAQKCLTGPRLCHAFDYRTRGFIPLEDTHPILARARSRRAEAVEVVSRAAGDTAGDGSIRPAVVQSIGWMPLKRSWATASAGSGGAVASASALVPATVPTPVPTQAPTLAPQPAPSAIAESPGDRPEVSVTGKGSGDLVDSRQQQEADSDPAKIGWPASDEPLRERPEVLAMEKESGDPVGCTKQQQASDYDPAYTAVFSPDEPLSNRPEASVMEEGSRDSVGCNKQQQDNVGDAANIALSASREPWSERPATPVIEGGSESPADYNIEQEVDDDSPARMALYTPEEIWSEPPASDSNDNRASLALSTLDKPSSERPARLAMLLESEGPVDSNNHRETDDDDPADLLDVEESRDDENVLRDPAFVPVVSEEGGVESGIAKPRQSAEDDNDNAMAEDRRSTDGRASVRSFSPAAYHAEEGNSPVTTSGESLTRNVPSPDSSTAPPGVLHPFSAAILPTRFSSGSKVATRSSTRTSQGLEAAEGPASELWSLARPPPDSSAADATPPKSGSSEASVVAITGKRKRITRGTIKLNAVAEKNRVPEVTQTPCRTIPVGDDHQACIPDMLSASSRSTGAPAEGAGGQESATLVWNSILDWDHRSRGILAGYLQAASAIARKNQCEEEALKALRETGCSLNHFEPALNAFSRQTSQRKESPWTQDQVKKLEDYVEESLQKGTGRNNRNARHKARPGVELDREDFIDLAAMGKSVPGKTPKQVMNFFYRYLAAARPLPGNRLQESEESSAQDRESVSPASSGRGAPPSRRPDGRSIRERASSERHHMVVVADSQVRAAVTAGQALCSPRGIRKDGRGASSSQRHVGGKGAAVRSSRSEPAALEVHGNDNNDGGHLTAGAKQPSAPPRHALYKLPRQVTWERQEPRAPQSQVTWTPQSDGDYTGQERSKRPRDLRPIQPEARQRGFRADHSARHGKQRRYEIPGGGAGGCNAGSWGRRDGLFAKPVRPDDNFSFMTPCWRLLERSSEYLEKDQLEYMRGLTLTHVLKPMSREQFLTRARSCLEELPHVWVSFVTMFNRLDDIPTVQLYEKRSCASSKPWAAATPASLPGPPYPETPPAVSAFRDIPVTLSTRVSLVHTGLPGFQHVPHGLALPTKETPPDVPWHPSRWAPRYGTNGRLLPPTGESLGGDGIWRSWTQPAKARW